MSASPYLFFDGKCEEAIAFYREAVGAEVEMLMRFKDNPEPNSCQSGGDPPADFGEKVMHATLRIGSTMVMASDGECQGQPDFRGFSLALAVSSEAQADKAFNALAEGGQVQMPLDRTFFSPRFGMVTDRFGVGWMVMVAQEGGQA